MMQQLCLEAASELPLKIESLEWDDPVLNFYGHNWGFSTMSAWRIVQDGVIVCSSQEQNKASYLQKMKGEWIKSIEIQSEELPVDPVFILSNGYRLEIFSTFYLEPWVFRLPTGGFYNGSPADAKWILNLYFKML